VWERDRHREWEREIHTNIYVCRERDMYMFTYIYI